MSWLVLLWQQAGESIFDGMQAAKRAAETSQPSPEACDDVAGLLKLAQERVDRQKMYGRETTMQDRLNTAVSAARVLVVKIVGFVASLPQKFLGVLKMTSAERGEMYKGWWTAIKKEAYHYWVRICAADVHVTCGEVLGDHAARLQQQLSDAVSAWKAPPCSQAELPWTACASAEPESPVSRSRECASICCHKADIPELALQMGIKLLGTDVRIAARLVSKTVRGRRLSR